MERIPAITCPPERQCKNAQSTGKSPAERQNITEAAPASSIWRTTRPMVDHRMPAPKTSATPLPYVMPSSV